MSECDHVWRAIDSNSSQCRKCGKCVAKLPTIQPQSVTWGILQDRIVELERQIERMKKALELIAYGQQHGQTTGPMRAYQMQNVAKEALKEK